MRRVLVIGCGGSGGKTLAFMMDQLKADLLPYEITEIPAVWQFVHVDSPTAEEPGPDNLPNVEKAGGSYISCGSKHEYAVIDGSVYTSLPNRGDKRAIATFFPKSPGDFTANIGAGAGQYRAIGRVLVLNKLSELRENLVKAKDRMVEGDAATEANHVATNVPGIGNYDANATPLVLVVTSMSGGSGASMALDVCRVVAEILGTGASTALFMYTSEVFQQGVNPTQALGMAGNTLAMLGEIFSAQTDSNNVASQLDAQLYAKLGINTATHRPFARAFPIGSRIGGQGAPFGDQSIHGVFRGIGRGLARLVGSEKALTDFIGFDLTNPQSLNANQNYQGWGCQWDNLPWGSFGYASMSMGRDRYQEYSAQRLARVCVDRLVSGHMQNGAADGAEAVLNNLWTTHGPREMASLGLPPNWGVQNEQIFDQIVDRDIYAWFVNTLNGQDNRINQWVDGAITALLANQPPFATPPTPADWKQTTQQALKDAAGEVLAKLRKILQIWALDWAQEELQPHLGETVRNAAATISLPYALKMLRELNGNNHNGLVADVVAYLNTIAATTPVNPAQFGENATKAITKPDGKLMENAPAAGYGYVAEELRKDLRKSLRNWIIGTAAGYAFSILTDYNEDLLPSMVSVVTDSLRTLEKALAAEPTEVGQAQVATDEVNLWPVDDTVPNRFSVAHNEIVLTPPDNFPDQFKANVIADSPQAAQGQPPTFAEAIQSTVRAIIRGDWEATGAVEAPDDTVSQAQRWIPNLLTVDPRDGAALIRTAGQWEIKLTPHDLLSRARLYITRPAQTFTTFIKESLRDYLTNQNVQRNELQDRENAIVAAFEATRSMAQPLIAVDDILVNQMHGQKNVQYVYKFSSIPFTNSPNVRNQLQAAINADNTLDASQQNIFAGAFRNDDVSRIDIFGAYPRYSPLVFSGVLNPIRNHWAGLINNEPGRVDFWKWRRSRPLPAVLPMGDTERRTMIKGWYLAQICGGLRIPRADKPNGRVAIFDRNAADGDGWLHFPDTLLSPRSSRRYQYDWLPIILESILLAYTQASGTSDIDQALSPYMVLRQYADISNNAPKSGHEDANRRLLTQLIQNGQTCADPSRIRKVNGAKTPEERAELIEQWVRKVRGKIRRDLHFDANYAYENDRDGQDQYRMLMTRQRMGDAPLLIDLTDDCLFALDGIIEDIATIVRRLGDDGDDVGDDF